MPSKFSVTYKKKTKFLKNKSRFNAIKHSLNSTSSGAKTLYFCYALLKNPHLVGEEEI